MTLAYDIVLGSGGLGTGIMLELEGNRTLGREESRPARLLDWRDYCKLHIVCHYVQRLLGPRVPVIPVGRVGDDDAGRFVLAEMRAAGLDTSFVTTSERPTLFSVCFLYPDGDGGNLSTSTSASAEVGAADIEAVEALFRRHRGRGIALALPEVPFEARTALLEMASEHRWLRVATVVPSEVEALRDSGVLANVDLLALNVEEAATLGGTSPTASVRDILDAVVHELAAVGCSADLVVTAGARGSWSCDAGRLVHAPSVHTGREVVSTAGAGDAHLSAVVVGLVAGVDLATANAFAALVSGLKVGSPHTIDPDLDAAAVTELAARLGRPLPGELLAALGAARP